MDELIRLAPLIAAAGGIVAATVAVINVVRAIRERARERPMLTRLSTSPGEDGGVRGYRLLIKNTGTRAARQISFRARAAPGADLGALVGIDAPVLAHPCEPGERFQLGLVPDEPFKVTTFLEVAVSYSDAVSRKAYGESFWLVVEPRPDGDDRVRGMSEAEQIEAQGRWVARWPRSVATTS